jgi:valyl-tRNA synthetase
LKETIVSVEGSFDRYDFGTAADVLWRFVWYEFCDWYVEAAKIEENRATRGPVLSFVWNNAMRLLHPIEPFISEEVWLAIPHDGKTIMTATWPDPLEVPNDLNAAAAFEAIQHAAERLRNLRAEMGLQPREPLTLETPSNVPDAAAALLAHFTGGTIERSPAAGDTLDEALAGVRARAPRELLEARYEKELARLAGEVERLERKLANESFVAKAAPDVVAKERAKLDGYRSEQNGVRSALESLTDSVA